MKEKLKQVKYKFIEFRYYKKYWKDIPKGVRRSLIELSICLGQLTDIYMLDKVNGEVVDSSFKIAQSRLESIEKYVDFLKEEKKNTDWITVSFGEYIDRKERCDWTR